ncbi:MAG: Gfo/Idh/MocA family oxidoreductase [Planctomycetes bacterium]|nr:Gfo/Idh/MocA family oxidoreductase [Planctomycetota bacterium]
MTRAHAFRRREFLKGGAAAAVFQILPSGARLHGAMAKLRTAHVGVGGMGGGDLGAIASHAQVEVAGLCDIDSSRLASAAEKHPGAKVFRDYREMLASLGDAIDAVVVSTPDHTHAPAAMSALNRGKHVYCQKPLTHEVFEARQLRLVAERKGVATQMGIQVHSSSPYRRAVAMIQSGVIGKVSAVHAWSNKNWGYDGGPFTGSRDVPDALDWNLWLGTAAERPYLPNVYHPANWRKLIDFGTGTLGDMGVHIFDTPYAALELTFPKWARTECRTPTGVGHPERNIVTYEFPGTRHTTYSMLWKWYDGADAPPKGRNAEFGLPDAFDLPGQGSLFLGEKGSLLLPHVAEAQLFPVEKFKDYRRPDVADGDHYHEWVDACLGNGKTSAGFSYAGPLTEALLLGVVANRFPGKTLNWDAPRLQVANLPDANGLLQRDYRKGFEVDGLGRTI